MRTERKRGKAKRPSAPMRRDHSNFRAVIRKADCREQT